MSNLKKFISKKGAEELRKFAAAMPIAIENIVQSTDKLMNVYNSMSEDLGPHSDSFQEMLTYVKNAQKTAAEAIEELPKGLEATAAKIDAHLAKKPVVPGN